MRDFWTFFKTSRKFKFILFVIFILVVAGAVVGGVLRGRADTNNEAVTQSTIALVSNT